MKRRVLLGALLALAAAGCATDNKLREPAKLVDIPKEAQLPDAKTLWTAHLGDGTDGLAAAIRLVERDGRLFSADADGRVAAYDVATGNLIWRTNTHTRIVGGPGTGPGLVLVGTRDAEVLALNASTGALIWKTVVTSEVAAAPVADADTVIARSIDGFVFGLRATTGERLWTYGITVPSLTLRGLSDPLITTTGRTIIGMDNGHITALELIDGQPTWDQVISQPAGRSELDRLTDIDAKLVLDPRTGYIYTASYGGELAAVEPVTGEARWRREIKSQSGVAVAGNRLAVAGDDGTIWLLDTDTGAVIWKQEGLKNRRPSPPVIYRGRVGVGDFEGYLHWLDIRTGNFIARQRIHKDPIRAPFLVDNGVLYGMDVEGHIFALSLPESPDDPLKTAPAAATAASSRSFGLFGGGLAVPSMPLAPPDPGPAGATAQSPPAPAGAPAPVAAPVPALPKPAMSQSLSLPGDSGTPPSPVTKP